MKAHDALRKAFIKYNIGADPYSVMELETFVISSRNEKQNGLSGKNYQSLVSNLLDLLNREEVENPDILAKKIADYVLILCEKGCD
ncbi:MAG: hypothetical protein C0171_05150 [Caldisphaera sp.]|nr:MAG: hypothetical protein C0171_05150 [Caldisphaera sp.]